MPMQRPKWLRGWSKGKNPLEGSLIIDIPDVKVVEASFDDKLVLVAIGKLLQSERVVSTEANATVNDEKHGTDLEWRIFYDSTVFPGFMLNEKAMDFLRETVALLSGNASVYNTGTKYIDSGNSSSKGNAPLLLDYEIAKKIEKAKEKK
jgi:hypothetical protein